MIPNYTEGRTPHRLMAYFRRKGDAATIVGGTFLTRDLNEIAHRFDAIVDEYHRYAAPIGHISFRPPKKEILTTERFVEVARWVLAEEGIDLDRDLVIFLDQKDVPHLHVVFSRINLDGKLWSNSMCQRRLIAKTREAEIKFGLMITREGDPWREKISKPAKRATDRTGDDLIRHQLYIRLRFLAERCTAWDDFAAEAEKRRVKLRVTRQSEAQAGGVSFGYGGHWFRGSKIARALSLPGIIRQLEANQRRALDLEPAGRDEID